MRGKPIAEHARFVLREATLDDAPFFVQLLNDPGWREFISELDIHSDADAREYIESRLLKSYSERGFGLWVVQDAAQVAVGLCGLVARDFLPTVDIGFAFLAKYRGQGYATQAAQEVLKVARDRFGLGRILAITLPHNDSSIRVLQRLGFEPDGEVTFPGTDETLSLFGLSLSPDESQG